nr:lysine-rich arabinogalactan protein 19-like [Procambarus clarkii]
MLEDIDPDRFPRNREHNDQLLSAAASPATTATNACEPTAAVTPAPATEATQNPTTSRPSPSATAPPTVRASTEPSTPETRPAAVTQPSRAQPSRSTSDFYSSDSTDEDVCVGTPSPHSRKCHYSAADVLHDTTRSTFKDNSTMTTRSQTTKTDKPKKKDPRPEFA